MLDYEWGMLNGTGAVDDSPSQPDQNRSIFDHYSFTEAANSHYLNNNHNNPHHENNDFIHHTHNPHHPHHPHNAHNTHHPHQHYLDSNPAQAHPHFGSLYDPRGYPGDCPYSPPLLSLEPESSISTGYLLMPKTEPAGCAIDFANNRIGLNLGGRTYFSSAEDDFVNRLYRRSRPLDAALLTSPRCQAEGCNADLTNAKHYHRRHKVCEFHSKASTVITAGLTQRFCQQCSRLFVCSLKTFNV